MGKTLLPVMHGLRMQVLHSAGHLCSDTDNHFETQLHRRLGYMDSTIEAHPTAPLCHDTESRLAYHSNEVQHVRVSRLHQQLRLVLEGANQTIT